MAQVNVQEAKTQLSRLLGLVEAGEEVVIARYGTPVAKLVSVAVPAPRRIPGTWAGAIEIPDDFTDALPEGEPMTQEARDGRIRESSSCYQDCSVNQKPRSEARRAGST